MENHLDMQHGLSFIPLRKHIPKEEIVCLGTEVDLQEVLFRMFDNDHYLVGLRK